MDASSKLHVLWHYCHALAVKCAHICILKQPNKDFFSVEQVKWNDYLHIFTKKFYAVDYIPVSTWELKDLYSENSTQP